jgi:hypothetical protein
MARMPIAVKRRAWKIRRSLEYLAVAAARPRPAPAPRRVWDVDSNALARAIMLLDDDGRDRLIGALVVDLRGAVARIEGMYDA